MPVVKKCFFCGGRVEPGTGLELVWNDGTVQFFCSSKCERNVKLGRKPHEIRWTERYRKMRGKA
jgi:large subunit ribosomal protein L24e